jgi:hypothetical protein
MKNEELRMKNVVIGFLNEQITDTPWKSFKFKNSLYFVQLKTAIVISDWLLTFLRKY